MAALLRSLYLDPRVGPGAPAVALGRRRRRDDAQPVQGDAGRRAGARQDRHAARQVLPVGAGGRRARRAGLLDPGRGAARAQPGGRARRAGDLRERDDALRARGARRADRARARARRRRARRRISSQARRSAKGKKSCRSRRRRRPKAPAPTVDACCKQAARRRLSSRASSPRRRTERAMPRRRTERAVPAAPH